MISSNLPHEPWTELSCDFTGPLPSGQSLMVVIDNYSRFPVVKVISNTAASTVIPELKEIFSLLGRPNSLKTDNGAPFSSGEFAKFAHEAGFNHIRVTPHWPQANGEVERIMKPLMKSIQCAKQEMKPWRDEIMKFLTNYRSTPHSTTGRAPSELLFNRKVQYNFPLINDVDENNEVRKRDDEKKKKMKSDYDKRKCKNDHKPLKIGDRVLLKRDVKRKTDTVYFGDVYEVTQVYGTQIIARNTLTGRIVGRNVSYFKFIK